MFWSGVFYGWPNKVKMTTTLLMFLLLFVVRELAEGQVGYVVGGGRMVNMQPIELIGTNMDLTRGRLL